MEKIIIFDVSYHENRVAILEDGKLVEVYIERPQDNRLVGNIYRGKVDRVLPGMQSAFVDIGHEKNAFLHVSDVTNLSYSDQDDGNEENVPIKTTNSSKIEAFLKEGNEITVQVMKEALGTKGPRITTNITIPGRSMVLLPCADYTGISKRIGEGVERDRLKNIAKRIKPKKKGLIMRTAAENIPENRLAKELRNLVKEWAGIKKREKKGEVPRLLYGEPDLLERVIRDSMIDEVDRLVINDKSEYDKVLRFLKKHNPNLKDRVEYFEDDFEIFERFNVENEINKAIGKKVWIKNGAYLIIDRTEALTVIDVNTGKFTGKKSLEDTVTKVNVEAAIEIARQLRLRDIGGIIVIDFIDMVRENHRKKVIKTLEEELRKDKTKTEVFGMTKLGLVEMTRKKVRQELLTILKKDCDNCHGFGKILSNETIARNIEKQLISYLANTSIKNIELFLSEDILEFFAGKEHENIKRIEKTYKRKIKLSVNPKLKIQEIKIREI